MAPPPRLSPSALNRFLDCEHRTYLDILEQRGELDEERRPPAMELLFERGNRHEEQVVAALGPDVVALDGDPDASPEERAALTLEAMRAGHRILHQACFVSEQWVGYPDFLIRVEEPSALADFSYEVHDAKLSSHAQPRHVFQLLFYTEELERLQGRRPARMHLILGADQEHVVFDPDDFAAYFARVRDTFAARYAELAGSDPEPAYPYPVSACEFCHWWHVCDRRRRDDDHLSLVAGLQRGQGLKLEDAGVSTMPALAKTDVIVPRLKQGTLATLRAQAGLQVRSRGLERPLHELLEPGLDRGLARLPEPSPGDVFFDFEGDQYWGDEGLEYLFGSVSDGGIYRPLWATTRAAERTAFETWMDWVTARLVEHPDLHVFHYNAYEVVALKKLVARHATREHELDELLRRKVFVDLYGIVRQALRAGIEGYGLKRMEPVIGFERDAELRGALGSMRRWQDWQQDGRQEHLDGIAGYNEDDCHATAALYAWLLARRPEAEAAFGLTLGALQPEPAREPSEALARHLTRVEEFRGRLLAGLPDDESQDTEAERARRRTFDLLSYHRHEAKPSYWALFARRERSVEQLRDEDPEALGDLEVLEREELPRSWEWTMRFPPQEYKLGADDDVDDPLAETGATIKALDGERRTVVVRRSKLHGEEPPRALGPGWPVRTEAQQEALARFAERVADIGLEPQGRLDAGTDLLLARAPRFRAGTPPLRDEPFDLARLKLQVRGLDDSVLVIQGPPGTGKTYTGARLALDLMDHGLRVGVMATSHKAINNVLRAIDVAAAEAGTVFRGWKKSPKGDNAYSSARVTNAPKRPPEETEDGGPFDLVAATAWHWPRDDELCCVDVLFVDEAGQVALADAIACSQAASSVVLLGDPQQLAHVSQGTHAHGTGASVLQHLLGADATVPRERGVLLPTTWRMHPEVTAFVSDTMYDGRLDAVAGCERQGVVSPGLSGSGLRLLEVEHADNRGSSIEEADAIAAEVALLLDGGRWTDRHGVEHPLTIANILVVTPYNAQVRCLRARLHPDARVGTVDKFQGQEAPVVLFSMASSSGDDVTRGMSFLFSRNRLNVAVSRAQALAVVVCSPRLLGARCATVEDMRLVNMLCRFADASEPARDAGTVRS